MKQGTDLKTAIDSLTNIILGKKSTPNTKPKAKSRSKKTTKKTK